jgi:hypothetical protein
MLHLCYISNERCYGNYGSGKIVSININYSWILQLEIIGLPLLTIMARFGSVVNYNNQH